MNVYSLVDSLFVANLVSTEALSAVNIVGPALAIALAVSVYFFKTEKGVYHYA